jgi:hypothetical protein
MEAERDSCPLPQCATHELRLWRHCGHCAGLLLDASFETATETDTDWRGVGVVSGSGSGTDPAAPEPVPALQAIHGF